MCVCSIAITIFQFVLNILLRSSCDQEDNYEGYRQFCETFVNFEWLAPVMIEFILDIITAVLTGIRYFAFNYIEFDD